VWYRKALEVNPKSPTVWINLATVLNQLGRWDESDDALLASLANGFNDPEGAVYRRVATYTRKGQTDSRARPQLVSFMKKVVAAYPQSDRYRASLGKALFENKNCAQAQPIFRDLAAKTPGDMESLNLLALTSWCLGDTDQARSAFQKSLAVDPNQPAVKEGLAMLDRGGAFR